MRSNSLDDDSVPDDGAASSCEVGDGDEMGDDSMLDGFDSGTGDRMDGRGRNGVDSSPTFSSSSSLSGIVDDALCDESMSGCCC